MNAELTESSEAPKPRKPLWRRILKWTIRAAVALIVLLAVAWGIFSYVSSRALEAEIAKLRAAGQPLTFAEWEKSLPKVSEADDAAPFYRAALALRRRSADDRLYELIEWVKADTAQLVASGPSAAEFEQVLAENALALEMADRGSALPQCAYDFGLANGVGAVLPQLSSARSLCRLLYLRTMWLARQGKPGQAADSLVSSLRTLRMFDRQPVLISYLVKIACLALDVEAVATVLEAGRLSDDQLAALDSALTEADPAKGLDQVWVAEQVYDLELFRNLIRPPRELIPQEGTRLPEAAQPNLLASPMLRLMVVERAANLCPVCRGLPTGLAWGSEGHAGRRAQSLWCLRPVQRDRGANLPRGLRPGRQSPGGHPVRAGRGDDRAVPPSQRKAAGIVDAASGVRGYRSPDRFVHGQRFNLQGPGGGLFGL